MSHTRDSVIRQRQYITLDSDARGIRTIARKHRNWLVANLSLVPPPVRHQLSWVRRSFLQDQGGTRARTYDRPRGTRAWRVEVDKPRTSQSRYRPIGEKARLVLK